MYTFHVVRDFVHGDNEFEGLLFRMIDLIAHGIDDQLMCLNGLKSVLSDLVGMRACFKK
jgi:hypothetical protein